MAELDQEDAAEAVIEARTGADGVPVLAVSGELDISNAAALEAAVEAIARDTPDLLVFDLSRLRFLDSAGVAVLLAAASKVGAVSLRDPSAAVRRIVELTGLSDVLPIER